MTTTMKTKLRKGDEVIVISGSARGQSGAIDTVDRKHGKVIIAGINLAKKHVKAGVAHPSGDIIDKPMPIAFNAVALLDPKTKKPTRIGYKVEAGKKVRVAKKSGSVLA